MRCNSRKTRLYSLDDAAEKANCKPEYLLEIGMSRKEFELMVAVPVDYSVRLLKRTMSSREIDDPWPFMVPNLLVLSKNDCRDLYLCRKAEIRDVSKAYFWDHDSNQLMELDPTYCHKSWNTTTRLFEDALARNKRLQWTAWNIHKIGSEAPLIVTPENVWVAKTEVYRFFGLAPDNPENDGERKAETDTESENRSELKIVEQTKNDQFTDITSDIPGIVGKNYKSTKLKIMNIIAGKRWTKRAGVFTKYSSKQPRNNEIAQELIKCKKGNFSKRLANAAAQIIRPEFAIDGKVIENSPLPSELPDVEKNYRSPKLKIMNNTSQLFWHSDKVEKNNKATYPEDENIIKYLKERGFGDTLAKKAVLILKPEFALPDRSKESVAKTPSIDMSIVEMLKSTISSRSE